VGPAARLYLAWRNLGHGEDPRYRAMRERIGERFGLVSLATVFGFQGLLVCLVSLPLQAGLRAPALDGVTILQVLGVLCWSVGLLFETVGDWQLARFRASPANAGAVMDRGLWRYTRHPNYFGDFMVWWGLYLVAVSDLAGLRALGWTAVGPAIMTFLLLRVSGVPLLERPLKQRRPGYEAYVRRTSAFFPWPPRAARD
jgi:steroid 5-alpha reductase family enzyme